MAVSGVQIPRTIIDSFQDLKIKKAHRYMLITLDESGTSLKAKTGARKTTAADFKKEFSAKECAFGVFDHPDNQRLIFVHWNPDNAPVKSKMASAAAAKGKSYQKWIRCCISQRFKTRWKVLGICFK